MNILILSVGTRNKIVQYFKNAIGEDGLIVVTDCSDIAPAVYEADKFYKVPKITDEGYIDIVLDLCIKESISCVFSLIDPELSLLAVNRDKFAEIGVTVLGSSFELCEMALNKWEMFNWLNKNGFNCAKSYINKQHFFDDVEKGIAKYPVFVKPICGSASMAISKAYDKETIELLFKKNDNLMIQEFLYGQEIGADCYIDILTGETVSIFTKKKIVMRAGETDKAVSFKDDRLFDYIKSFISKSGFVGQIDIDIFDVNGEYYISEVNPRFGGGYPHAYECGCDHISLIKNNLEGKINSVNIGNYEENIYMMKYNEILVKKL